ncbi:HAD family hydrolase [Afifella pfennigii]|uniref:HAD family hydrolase n=1 Tax=Afifella pfennigii TaxID=209897 RepID=UPI001FDFF68C|nr:HAD family hydrolase [Afifella pfennigii]
MIDTVAFDADDTLWQNEKFFQITQQSFESLLKDHSNTDDLGARLLAAEKRNLEVYGFGIKGFVLSMIETAIEVTDETLPPATVRQILEIGREMMAHPIELLPGAGDAVEAVSSNYRTVLLTKGDLFDQERKIAQSGLAKLFDHIEIVPQKSMRTYEEVFGRLGSGASQGLMVGNSLRSDVNPMLEAGGWAIYVAHPLTWEVEHAEVPNSNERFRQAKELREVPDLIKSLTVEARKPAGA